MPVKPLSDFDRKFSGIQYIVSPDGNEVRKTNGDPPVYVQFQPPFTTSWNPVTERVDVGFGGSGSAVPDTRVLNTTAPLRIDGGASADLSADRTIAIQIDNTSLVESGGNLKVGVITAAMHGAQTDASLHADATAVTAGFMPPGMYTLLDTATNLTTPAGALVRRDGSGDAAFRNIFLEGSNLDTVGEFRVLVDSLIPIYSRDGSDVVLGRNVTIGQQDAIDPDNYQNGNGILWMPNCQAPPTAAPSTGAYIFCEGDVLKKWEAGAGAPVTL